MLNRMHLLLVAIIIITAVFGQYLPPYLQSFFYSLSLTIKNIIVFLLPIIIFGLSFKTILKFSYGSSAFVLLIVSMVCLSNFCTTFLSHLISKLVYSFNFDLIQPVDVNPNKLNTLWNFTFPKIISNDQAMLLAFFTGMTGGVFKIKYAHVFAKKIDMFVGILLKALTNCIPVFIAGFVIKLQYDGEIGIILKDYSRIFMVIFTTQMSYTFIILCFLSEFKLAKVASIYKNLLPAMITGFSTMSSAAALPLSIIAAQKTLTTRSFPKQ